MKTFIAKNETVQRDWYVVDAEGKTLPLQVPRAFAHEGATGSRPSRVDTNELWKQMVEIRKRKDPRVTFNPEYNREELERFFHDPEAFMDHTPCMSSWHFAQILADGDSGQQQRGDDAAEHRSSRTASLRRGKRARLRTPRFVADASCYRRGPTPSPSGP